MKTIRQNKLINQYFFCSSQERYKLGYNSSPGIKLVADSPIRQNSPLNGQGLDVTPYQPPWQALVDYAMNSNIANENLDTGSPDFKRLFHQVARICTLTFFYRLC